MRRVLPVLLAAVLLLAAAPALADEPGKGKSSEHADEAEHEQARGKAPVGSFQVEASARSAQGRFVDFDYDANGIRGFAADGVILFDATVADAQAEGHELSARAEGAQMRVDAPTYEFVAHDNPLAAARMRADGTVVLTFAQAVVLTREGDERAAFTVGNLTGEIRGDGLVLEGQVARAHEDVLVVLDNPQGSSDLHRADINHAIGKGHVGAEATFQKNATEVKEDLVSYGNVTMQTVRAQKGNLTLLVEGHGTDGRVLVLNVDGDVLGAQKREDLNVFLDNATVQPADNLTDILDPDNDGYSPEYYVVFDPNVHAFQLLVSVPHYSVHTLSVTTALILPPPSVVVGIVLGLVVLVPSAFVLFRRPKA